MVREQGEQVKEGPGHGREETRTTGNESRDGAETANKGGEVEDSAITIWSKFLDIGSKSADACCATLQYGSQLVLLLLIVFFLKKHHKPYWQKWDLAQVFNPALNRRFIILAAPMVVQYAMQVRMILPHNRPCCCARVRFEFSGIHANRSTHWFFWRHRTGHGGSCKAS